MANSREEILALEFKARAGDLDAKHSLGMAYRRGDGVAQDKAKGASLIIEAADGGCKPALSSVGVCYYFGDGVPKNHRLAMKWYQAAASAGIWEGFFNVADLFDDSDEIAKNPVEALAWFTSSLGVMSHSADRMQAIVGSLSDENLDLAARRAVQIMKAAETGKPLDMVGDFVAVSPIPGSVRHPESSPASLLSYLLFFHLHSQTQYSDGLLLRELLNGKSPIYVALEDTAAEMALGAILKGKDQQVMVTGLHRLEDGSFALLVYDDFRHIEKKMGKHFGNEYSPEELQQFVKKTGIRHVVVNHDLPTMYVISKQNDPADDPAPETPPVYVERRTGSGSSASETPPKLEIDWENIDPADPKGYYAYFGVEPDAPLSAITQAYKRILRECADNAFVINEANIAYTVLSNPHKRRFYDKNQVNLTRLEAERRKPKVNDQPSVHIFPSEDDTPNNSQQSSGGFSNRHYGRTMGLPVEPEDRRPRRTSSGGCLVVMLPLSVGILWLLS
jgi:hypothetical protein